VKGGGLDVASDTRSPEAAEAQLERFISQRHEKRVASEGERQAEEMWMESVARYNERERRQMRAEWTAGTVTRQRGTGAPSPLS
jgi:hypothetical protein